MKSDKNRRSVSFLSFGKEKLIVIGLIMVSQEKKLYLIFFSISGSYWSLLGSLSLPDNITGVILLFGSLVMLCVCLFLMVTLLKSVLQGKLAGVIQRVVNADLPGPFSFLTGKNY